MFQNNSAMAQQSIDPQLLQMLMMQHQQQQPQQTGPQIPVPQNGQSMPYMPANPQAFLQQLMGQGAGNNGGNIGSWGFSPLGLMPWSSFAPTGQTAQQMPSSNYQPLAAPSGTAGYLAPAQIQQAQNPLLPYFARPSTRRGRK